MGSKPVSANELGVSIGQVFETKYRVDAIIGQGGMGIVCACTNLDLNKKIAIKMLKPDVLTDVDATTRFKREASAASQLTSEYVAKVTDYGVFDNRVPFMVMEYLDGLDLADYLEQSGTIPVMWACDIVLQTAEGLAEAHSLGIVHRDVKPTNLFLTWRPDGTSLVKVLDFGISKSRTANGVDMQLTQTQSLLGTPSYMSPEQMRSARDVDGRTDIWSLGTVLYEIVEGHRPFEADSFSEMCVKVAMDDPIPMQRAPIELQRVIARCLAKNPVDRYANMADLGADLIPLTKDPHHSANLVERMQRLVRKSWDNGVPQAVSGQHSAPSMPWANIGSEPGLTALPSSLSGAAIAVPGPPGPPSAQRSAPNIGLPMAMPSVDPSQPTYREDSVSALQPKRRWLPWAIVGTFGVVGGIILVVSLSQGHGPTPLAGQQRATDSTGSAGGPPSSIKHEALATGSNTPAPPTPTPPTTPPPTDSKAVDAKPDDTKPDKVDATKVSDSTNTKPPTNAALMHAQPGGKKSPPLAKHPPPTKSTTKVVDTALHTPDVNAAVVKTVAPPASTDTTKTKPLKPCSEEEVLDSGHGEPCNR